MQKNSMLLIALGVAAVFVLMSTQSASAATNLSIDLSGLPDPNGDVANYLPSLESEMMSRGYTREQMLYMLSQILHESGMATNIGNEHLMGQNNFAGLTASTGGYAAYNSISDFMDAYDGFLTKWNDPIGATSLTDFNNRLVANHYYTDNPTTYLNNLTYYYNLLS